MQGRFPSERRSAHVPLLIVLLAVFTASLLAQDVSRYVYVTDAQTPGFQPQTVDLYSVNPNSAQLRFRSTIPLPQSMASPVIDPLGRFFYDILGYNTLQSWNIDARTSELHLISSQSAFFLGGNIAVHPSGKLLYANDTYEGNGALEAFEVSPSGELTEFASYPPGGESGPVLIDPSGRFLYIADTDDIVEYAYAIDQSTGVLTPLTGSPFPNIQLLSLDPLGRFAFGQSTEINQTGIEVYVIDQKTGQLTLVPGSPFAADSVGGIADPAGRYFYQSAPGLLDAFAIDQSTGALSPISGSPFHVQGQDALAAIDPSGRFVYMTDGTYNRIDTYALNRKTGGLGILAASVPALGEPRSIAILQGPSPVAYRAAFVFVANELDDTITPYRQDPTHGQLAMGNAFPAGPRPSALGGDPTGHFLYALSGRANTISGFRGPSFTPIPGSPFRTGHEPSSLVVLPSENFLYVSNTRDDSVSIFGIAKPLGSLAALGTQPVSGSGPGPLAIDPSGGVLFVGNTISQSLSAYYLDQVNGSLSELTNQGSPIQVGFTPGTITVDPVDPYVYILDAANNLIHAYLFTYYPYTNGPAILQPISGNNVFSTGRDPVSQAVHAQGRYLYVANRGSSTLSGFEINRNDGSLTPLSGFPMPVDPKPSAVTTDVSGKFLMVTCSGDNTISTFRIAPDGTLDRASNILSTGNGPSAVAAAGTVH